MMLAQYSVSTRLWMEFILIQTKFAYKGPLLNYAMHICTHIAQPYSIGVLKFMLNLVTTTDGVVHAQYPEVSSIFKVSDNAFLSTSMGRLNIPCPSPLPQQHKKVRNIRVIKLQRFFIPCPPLLPPQKAQKGGKYSSFTTFLLLPVFKNTRAANIDAGDEVQVHDFDGSFDLSKGPIKLIWDFFPRALTKKTQFLE